MKSDQQIKRDVVEELEWDSVVNETEIGVEVKNGVVTLTGHLDSYAEKLAAEHAAQRVAGIKGIAIEIDVRLPGSSQRNDADIARTAQHILEWSTLVPRGHIKILVEGGWITMTGKVDYSYQRDAAEGALRGLMGVNGISNQVILASTIKAADVKLKIEAALQRRAHKETKAIEVIVSGDEITLNGSVAAYAERREAIRAAMATKGVVTVIDNLDVT